MLKRGVTTLCHLAWLLSCLPGWLCFRWALLRPRSTQERLLRRLIVTHRASAFGQAHGFATIATPADFAQRVPLAEYEDFAPAIDRLRRGDDYALAAESPELLEPTSGTSGAAKLIPVTRALRREFAAAVDPWIAELYLAHLAIMLGRHYWAVSPNTPIDAGEADSTAAVPIGFSDDADYLGIVGRFASRRILANPRELRRVTHPEDFMRFTLLFLLADRELRLVSVWHPSFFTLLLEAIPRHLPHVLEALRTGELPALREGPEEVHRSLARAWQRDPQRADELAAMDLPNHPENLARVWPRLAVVSCWGGSRSEPWLGRLRALFPHAFFQLKGLLATEGCVSLPTGRGDKHPCALTSHYLEFIEPATGVVRSLWNLTSGEVYSVVLTTGAGLWRYRLHDLVRVVGFSGSTPCVEFVGKDNAVSDLVGEKLAEQHVADALAAAQAELRVAPAFAMLVPVASETGQSPRYVLLVDSTASSSNDAAKEAERLAGLLEIALCGNYHYAHARRLGQIEAIRGVVVKNGLARFRRARAGNGARAATIKVPALATGLTLSSGWWQDSG